MYRAYIRVVGKFQGAGGVVRMTTYDVQSILHLGLVFILVGLRELLRWLLAPEILFPSQISLSRSAKLDRATGRQDTPTTPLLGYSRLLPLSQGMVHLFLWDLRPPGPALHFLPSELDKFESAIPLLFRLE